MVLNQRTGRPTLASPSTKTLNEDEDSINSLTFLQQVHHKFASSTMNTGWLLFTVIGALTFIVLRTFFHSSVIVINFGIFLLAGYLTDGITKAFHNILPRKYLPDVSKKAVFITGCDSGFGGSLARRLDSLGVKVYAGCLNTEGEGALELKEETSDLLQLVSVDVTSDDDVKAAAKFVGATLGERNLWALVNNAGVAAFTEIEWCPVETYRRVLDVNALGPIRVTQAFLPLLRESAGRIVMVASLAGRYTFPGFSAYSMSKYAAVSFADGLRREMKKWSISVHTVEPTLYKTPISSEDILKKNLQNMWDQCPDDVQASYGKEYFLDFQESFSKHLKRAKPTSKIAEVVDDMLHATIGDKPKLRYVPSIVTQIRARILSSLPTDIQDYVLCLGTPRTPPAAVKSSRQNLPPFINPYDNKIRKRSLFRHMSMPVREKTSLDESDMENTRFKF